MNRRLYRSRTDSVLGGVAGGLAEYMDVDPSIVRIVWAVLAIVSGGLLFLLYIVMWIVVPEGTPGPYVPGPGAQPGWNPPDGQPAGPPAAPVPPAAGEVPAAAPGETPPPPPTAAAPAWTPPGGDPYAGRRHRRRGRGNGGLIFGIILVGLGVWFLLDNYIPDLRSDLLWPVGLVILGLVLLVVSTRRSSEE